MSIIHTLGLTDDTTLKFPVGLYTSKEYARGATTPFAVLIQEGDTIKMRVGYTNERIKTTVVVD